MALKALDQHARLPTGSWCTNRKPCVTGPRLHWELTDVTNRRPIILHVYFCSLQALYWIHVACQVSWCWKSLNQNLSLQVFGEKQPTQNMRDRTFDTLLLFTIWFNLRESPVMYPSHMVSSEPRACPAHTYEAVGLSLHTFSFFGESLKSGSCFRLSLPLQVWASLLLISFDMFFSCKQLLKYLRDGVPEPSGTRCPC